MANVYFKRTDRTTNIETIKAITRELLDTVVKEEKVTLEDRIPLKVHFGEPGNVTFIGPENFDGIIDYLQERDIETAFIETNVLYGGYRHRRAQHLETARKHGFTKVPVIIADGDSGEEYQEVVIDGKHFRSCKLGKAFADYDQLLVLAHFKGHTVAGFGGAIKQLSMGCASKGGKLAMHMGIKPKIVNRKCVRCHLCEKGCAENAITIGERSQIDHDKCVGCGACVAICPNKAVSIVSLGGIARALNLGKFQEKLVEYAYAAQKGKRNIYINYVMNITSGCDCMGRRMKVLMDDIGILASTDPVALDRACYDLVSKAGKKFRGANTFEHAERIGLGTITYDLKEL